MCKLLLVELGQPRDGLAREREKGKGLDTEFTFVRCAGRAALAVAPAKWLRQALCASVLKGLRVRVVAHSLFKGFTHTMLRTFIAVVPGLPCYGLSALIYPRMTLFMKLKPSFAVPLSMLFIVPAAIIGAASPAFAATTHYGVITTQMVGESPYGVAVNPVTNKKYVVNSTANSVSILDATNTVIKTVTVGTAPHGVAVNPVTGFTYVTNLVSNTVSILDKTDTVIKSVTVGNDPFGVAVNPLTGFTYVPNSLDGTVSVLDATNTVVKTVSVGDNPGWVAVNEGNGTTYVSNSFSDTVSVLDRTNTVVDTVSVGRGPAGVAVNQLTGIVYVANYSADTISVITPTIDPTGPGYYSYPVTTTIDVWHGPVGVGVNPATGSVFVSNLSSNSVSVIDGSSNKVVATVPVEIAPTGVAVNQVTNSVFVTNGGSKSVSVIMESISPTITSPAPQNGTVGTPYTFTLTATGFPAPTFAITGGNLPDGLSLDSATGVISGTPTRMSTGPVFTFTITANNGAAPPDTADYDVYIAPAIPCLPWMC